MVFLIGHINDLWPRGLDAISASGAASLAAVVRIEAGQH
jgi:hypothetical protein